MEQILAHFMGRFRLHTSCLQEVHVNQTSLDQYTAQENCRKDHQLCIIPLTCRKSIDCDLVHVRDQDIEHGNHDIQTGNFHQVMTLVSQ